MLGIASLPGYLQNRQVVVLALHFMRIRNLGSGRYLAADQLSATSTISQPESIIACEIIPEVCGLPRMRDCLHEHTIHQTNIMHTIFEGVEEYA